jgi:transposase-like protein
MDLRRTKIKFTQEQRLAIIEEYEKGTLTGKEIAKKYGFRSPSVIYNWRERLLNPRQRLRISKKSSIFAAKIRPIR